MRKYLIKTGPQKKRSKLVYGLAAILLAISPLYFFVLHANASALSFVCANSAAATSVASCAGGLEQTGDLLLVSAGATATGTIPSLATGFTNINTAAITSGPGASRIALRMGWCVVGTGSCPSSSAGSGIWTSATDVVMQVFRGQGASPIGNNVPTTGSGASTVNYPATTLSVADGSSWFVGQAIRNTGDSHMATAPAGMTNHTSAPATPVIAGNDTNGATASNWPSTNVSGFGASASYASIVVEILASPQITVGATGTQAASMTIPSTGNFVGGAFTVARDIGTTNVTSVKITENGTVNAASNLSNLILYYKQEAACESTFPSSGTTQFNSTAGSFTLVSGSTYTSTVTGTMSVGTSQVCIYAKVDVGSGATNGDQVEFAINNPSTDVVASVGNVAPGSTIAILGTTTLVPPGPTSDQVMRGGEWFSGGAEQSLFWAQ